MGKTVKETQWYEYDWQYEGSEAIYCVDMTYDDDQKLGDLLISVVCKAKKGSLSDGEYRKYEKLRNKILKKTGITYVGLIESNNAVRFFFYTDDTDASAVVEKCIRKVADRVSYDCRYDKKHEFYRHSLLPDIAKNYTEENRKQLKLFADNGDCMTVPRKLNFHVYFPSEPLRILFEEQARLSGYAVGVGEFSMEYELPHGIVVHKICTLNKADVDDATSRLIYIAEKYEGRLLFWDCVLVPKRKTL